MFNLTSASGDYVIQDLPTLCKGASLGNVDLLLKEKVAWSSTEIYNQKHISVSKYESMNIPLPGYMLRVVILHTLLHLDQ